MSLPQGSSILIIDDDSIVAKSLVDILVLNGYHAARADSGEEGLERLDKGGFDLVLLDIRLPNLNGYETCVRIRERYGISFPVIMITSFGDAAAVKKGHEVGADDFVQKPVDTPLLLLKVRALLRYKRLHDGAQKTRREAQDLARNLALLHDIGRDWSLVAEPEEFARMVTARLAALIGAPICILAHYDPATREMAAALPVHGLPDELARRLRYAVTAAHRNSWNFRSGKAYLSNSARHDPRLDASIVELIGAESVVMVPVMSEGWVLGLVGGINKPGGFTEGDVQLLSIFAGPAASFMRSRLTYDRQRHHTAGLQRVVELMGAMASASSRGSLVSTTLARLCEDLGFDHAAWWVNEDGSFRVEAESGLPLRDPETVDRDRLNWALRGAVPLKAQPASSAGSEIAVPVRAGETGLGVLNLSRRSRLPVSDEETALLHAVAQQLAIALQRAAGVADAERLARQMATLYDLGLETSALRDLPQLFGRATEEAGRLIRADHTSVFRLVEDEASLRLFAGWARDRTRPLHTEPVFRIGEGIAGKVARDGVPAMVNDADVRRDFVRRGNTVARLLCVPLTYFDQEKEVLALFGVLNATRLPGGAPFAEDDLEFLTRFAGQLSIAVANSVAFAAERERSDELVLVNTVLREVGGKLSRDRILDTACRRIQETFRHPVVTIDVPDGDDLRRVAAFAGAQPLGGGWQREPLHEGIVGRAFREGRTIVVPDVSAAPEYRAVVASTRSEVAIPIRSGGEVVAVLNVESDRLSAFRRSQVLTLETLADGIASILRNAELFQALEETNAKLVEMDRTKSELVNVLAHDFRSPLAGILGYAELLEWQEDLPREERLDQARAIVRAATHMSNLVEKTLKTTRLETGQFPFEFGLTELGAIVRSVLARQPEDAAHPISLAAPDDPLPIWADRERIAEVLENLLSNAVRFSPDGGPVRVELAVQGESVTVRVSDSGVGIAPGDRGKLFKPFSRIRNKRTAEVDGSGLGLYICERIVRAHGGAMTVASSGVGSAFTFSLPLYGAAAQTRAAMLLVAAADEGTRREVRRVAHELGFQTHEVADGVEAVEAALRLVPQAIVIDRILPRLGADEVALRLREQSSTRSVPIVALTSDNDIGGATRLFKACVSKPLEHSQLVAALEAVALEPEA